LVALRRNGKKGDIWTKKMPYRGKKTEFRLTLTEEFLKKLIFSEGKSL